MLNPLDLRWLWNALRGRSLTFAMVFVLAVLGVSAPDRLREWFEPLGLSRWQLWLAPLLLFWLLVRAEPWLIPSETIRRRLALGLVAAAVAAVFLLPRL